MRKICCLIVIIVSVLVIFAGGSSSDDNVKAVIKYSGKLEGGGTIYLMILNENNESVLKVIREDSNEPLFSKGDTVLLTKEKISKYESR